MLLYGTLRRSATFCRTLRISGPCLNFSISDRASGLSSTSSTNLVHWSKNLMRASFTAWSNSLSGLRRQKRKKVPRYIRSQLFPGFIPDSSGVPSFNLHQRGTINSLFAACHNHPRVKHFAKISGMFVVPMWPMETKMRPINEIICLNGRQKYILIKKYFFSFSIIIIIINTTTTTTTRSSSRSRSMKAIFC